MNVHRTLLAALACSAVVVAQDARGDEPPSIVAPPAEAEVVLTRARALTMGAEHGPIVKEAAAPLRAAGALRDTPTFPYAPRVTAFAGRRTGAFGAGFELGGGVAQDLSLRGLGSRRGDVAAAVQRVARSEVERARLEGAAIAALAWVDVLEAQELMRVRAAARQDADEIARVARARTDRGVATPAEAALAASEVGVAELGERDAEGRLFDARASLKFAVGIPQRARISAAGDLYRLDADRPSTPPPTEHPSETAARSRIELARADGKLARALATPTLALGVNLSREGQGEQLFTGTITLPLLVLDPARFDAARHETNVAVAEGNVARIRAELARDVAMAEHDREHTREVRETLATRVLVPLRESVRLARAAYQTGTQDVTVFLLVRQRLIAAEERLGSSAADVLRADLRYDLARGTLLAAGKP